jgi:hypothetical protein
MNISFHRVTRIEIEPVTGPYANALCRSMTVWNNDGDVRTEIDLFGDAVTDLSLNMKAKAIPADVSPEGDSASAPDAAVATSEVAL